MIGSEGIDNILHQWQEDSLITASSSNAAVEGATAPSAVQNVTVMRNGTTQILVKTASVSGTADRVKTYGRDKELAYQLGLRSAELKRDFELSLIGCNQAKVTGTDSTARRFASYFSQLDNTALFTVSTTSGALNTPLTSQTTGAIAEAALLTIVQTLYTNGVEANTLLLMPQDKVRVSAFVTNSRTVMVDNGQKQITNTVDIYTSPFGELKVVMTRFLLGGGAAVFDPSMWKKLVLRNWFRETLAKTGDSTQVQIIGEFGLKHKNYAASGGFLNLTV
jgi:hypothetical protein